jgi:hypothetical protein
LWPDHGETGTPEEDGLAGVFGAVGVTGGVIESSLISLVNPFLGLNVYKNPP